MKRIFKWIFCPNWVVLWSDDAEWVINQSFDGQFGLKDYKERETCFYVIKFSLERQEFKLFTSGYNPKEHTFYQYAMQKLSEFQLEQYKHFTKNKGKWH